MTIDDQYYNVILKTLETSIKFAEIYQDVVALPDDTNINECVDLKLLNIIKDPPEGVIDKVTCEVTINPLFLRMQNTDDILIDYRTCYNISKTKMHPYTRDYIDLPTILDYNAYPDIIIRKNNVLSEIKHHNSKVLT